MLNSHSLLMSSYTVCQTGSFWSFIFGAYPLNCILKFDNAVRDGQLPIWEFVLKRIVPQTFFPLGLFAPACAVLRDLQTLTLAHIYQKLHSASFCQVFFKPSKAMVVQWNQDETPVWKILRVVSRRKGGERVRWETGDGHRLPTLLPSLWWAPRLTTAVLNSPGTRFNHPQLSTLHPLLSPHFLCKKSSEANLADNWLYAASCDIARQWDDRFTVKFLKEIPPQEKLDRQAGAVSVQSVDKASRWWQKKHGHKRMHNNELLSGEGEENEANCCRRACPSHGHEGPGMAVGRWRPWEQILRLWRLPHSHGSYDNDTGCGRWEGADWEARDSQAHVYCRTKVQQGCHTCLCVCVSRLKTCSSIQN